MNRRRGITLVEVLAAIFIMGIGLLALLTLFPLGALSMANSVRDNNAAMAGSSAIATAQAFDLRNDPLVIVGLQTPPSVNLGPPTNIVIAGLPIQPNGPGYPIYVDPTYANLGSTPPTFFANNIGFIPPLITGNPPVTPGIKRIAPFFNNYSVIASGLKLPSISDRYFTYLDDVTWDPNGMPRDPNGNAALPANVAQQIDRPGSLSWAYMIRPGRRGATQATLTSPFQPLAEMSVVIYRSRSVNTPSGEAVFTATGAAGSTTINLNYILPPGAGHDVRVGDFILDTTFDIVPDPLNPNNFFGSVHGYFYKIVDILDQGKLTPATGILTLTLATPLRMNVSTVVHMKNVIDVQERGIGGKP